MKAQSEKGKGQSHRAKRKSLPLTVTLSLGVRFQRQRALTFAAVALSFAFCALSFAEDEDRFDPTVFARDELPEHASIAGVMRLADGQVWAANQGSPVCLLARENGRWREAARSGDTDGLRNFNPRAVTPGHGDDLWLLSNEGNERLFAVKFNRATRQFAPPIPLPFEKARAHQVKFHPAPDGSLWVTAGDPRVFRLADGEWREMFRATDEMSFTEKPPARFGWNKVDLLFDCGGAAWIFTSDGAVNCVSLKGMARVADGEAKWLEKIEGLPEGAFGLVQFVNVSGREELWVHVKGQGMFRVQTDTLTAAPLEFPEDTKQSPIWELFVENGALWAVTQPGLWGPLTVGDTNSTLWRMTGGGGWEKKLAGLDAEGARHHPRLAVDGGLWLGSNGRGLWWIPADGEPVNLDWTKGFPIGAPADLFSDTPGTLTVTGYTRSYRFDIARATALKATKPTGIVTRIGDDFTRAQDGTLFTVNSKARVLRQWTQDGWRDIPYGDGLGVGENKYEPETWLGADSRNRVWLMPRYADRDLARVWNIDTQTWDTPRPYMELIAEAAAAKPDWHFLFNIMDPGMFHYRREAVFDRRGRAAFVGEGRVLCAYDGRQWARLGAKDFPAEKNVWFGELQNAAAGGDILVLIGSGDKGQWYRWNADGQWSPLDTAEFPHRRAPLTVPLKKINSLERPPGWKGEWHGLLSGFVTEDGDEWLLLDGMLCRRRGERLVTWFEPGQSNPFITENYLKGMMADSFGRYLFFNGSRMAAVNRAPKGGAAVFKAEPVIGHLSGDSVSVDFRLVFADGDQLRWRLGGGEWSAWKKPEVVTFSGLAPGEYAVSYEAMNKWLETSPSAAVKFTIKYDVDKLVREAVEKLFAKNWDERSAAVKTLARFPEQARAALQQVAADRQRLSDSDRWWLDAALGQVGGR